MRFTTLFLGEIWRVFRFSPLSSFGVLLTVYLAMLLAGLFGITSKNLAKASLELEKSLTCDVFLEDKLPSSDIDSLKQKLTNIKGIKKITYLSKEQALEKMSETFGEEFVQGLEENPLPACFVLTVDKSYLKPEAADSLIKKISSLSSVEEVVFAGSMVERLSRITKSVTIFGFAVGMVVILSAMFIIANTIGIAVFGRRKTIEIMRLVGAAENHVMFPFISLGAMIGFCAAGLAMLTLGVSVNLASQHLAHVEFFDAFQIAAFILGGTVLGILGAFAATKKIRRHDI